MDESQNPRQPDLVDNHTNSYQQGLLETPIIPQFPVHNRTSGAAIAGFVCSLLALIFNSLLVTFVIGLPLGLIGLILSLAGYRNSKGRAGTVLSLLSFVILLLWSASLIFPLLLDQTLKWSWFPMR